ncbi:LPS assembly protein LptD [Sandaracinobacter sp. RS1-74]|nr:LPS assembly protein LptD [Sandaracinobacteroides sayramensis]
MPMACSSSPLRPVFSAALLALLPAVAAHAQEPGPPSAAPALAEPMVEFEADQLVYDENVEVITATGNVRVRRENQTVTADTVVYNRRTGLVSASGNVMMDDGNGIRAVADDFELTESLRDGAVENLLLILSDGSRLAAKSGVRENGVSRLDRAAYSPCAVVDEVTGCPKEPVWQLKAVRVVHDPMRGRVFYTGARLEMFGVPVVALPKLSHPDSFDKSQTGLLQPDFSISRELGGEVRIPYLWSIAPDQDLTLTGNLYTNVRPVIGADYRQLFAGGPIQIGGLVTYARGQREDLQTGEIVSTPERLRGAIQGNGRIEHGDGWRSSFSARLTNDDNFLGRYQVSLDTRLRSTYALERFEDRAAVGQRYFSVRGWYFQDLTPTSDASKVPVALPLVDLMWRLPDKLLGGQVLVQANSLGLYRKDGQSMARALAFAQWDRSFLTPMGQRITFTGLLRGDVYTASDSLLADEPVYAGSDGWAARFVPLAAVDMEWPFAGQLFGGTQTLSPRVQIVASTSTANGGIPNEDSRAIDLEDSNLFSLNRFPGYDRWEGGTRITYGVDWRWSRPGLALSAQMGQSYRLDNNENYFPQGTGLSGRTSDIVGRASVRIGRYVEVTQRLRLDKNNLAIRRNETDVAIGSRQTFVSVGYLKYNRNIDLEDLTDHEEVRAGARVAFGNYWAVFGSTVIDLTSRAEDVFTTNDGFQPIRHRLGVSYTDECFEFGVTWKRNYVDNPNAREGNTFLFSIKLRNLG